VPCPERSQALERRPDGTKRLILLSLLCSGIFHVFPQKMRVKPSNHLSHTNKTKSIELAFLDSPKLRSGIKTQASSRKRRSSPTRTLLTSTPPPKAAGAQMVLRHPRYGVRRPRLHLPRLRRPPLQHATVRPRGRPNSSKIARQKRFSKTLRQTPPP